MLWRLRTIQMSRYVRKRTFGHVLPAKIQISLCIRSVWSESSLGVFWIAKDAKFFHADNEDSNQTTGMRRMIWVSLDAHARRSVYHDTDKIFVIQTLKHNV